MDPAISAALIILGGVALVGGAVVYLGYRAERRRAEALRAAADALGFEFRPAGDPAVEGWLGRFHLFTRGHRRRFRSVLRGRTRDLDVAVFDYEYKTGGGKSAEIHKTSVVCVRAAGLALPEFGLRPEGFWHKVGSAVFGVQDIDFDGYPKFSKAYLLKGPDEAAVRAAFTDAALAHFEATPGVSVEAAGDVLVYYRHEARVDPAKVREFLEEGFAVLGLFRPAPSGGGAG